ncbi:MAG: tRNA (adenosine(37)-N6)-threonylcarbamoyltransferase complex transferase subunit TsaD [bacterium]|nr:tRNA (adenosine(37)-N6)-threonylcarbamoyltransferase complex transferase subunit TsaD [bacterium]
MKILAIETSCDETGIAVVEGTKIENGFEFTTLNSTLLSQAALHSPYGGVYPNLAKREHIKNLPVLFEKFSNEKVDAIAVTQGPGLEPALWTGIEFAKKLAHEWQVPLIPVNHMEGHLISSLAQKEHSNILENVGMSLQDVKLPVLALLISGGHTEFVLMKEWFQYKIIGETLDDAVGECFDKVARMLDLPYPGGPEISKLATKHRKKEQTSASARLGSSQREPRQTFAPLPRPMLNTKNCDVSFSGLKTAALYALREYSKATPSRAKKSPLTQEEKAAFAAEFEDAVADVFVTKTRRALEETGANTFVIGGGVAANRYLRERLQTLVLEDFPEVEMRLPDPSITGDNAVMIAQAALARALSGKNDAAKEELKAVGNLSIAS